MSCEKHIPMGFAEHGADDARIVQQLRPDLEIGLGCVYVQSGRVDTPETIVERVDRAREYVAPERLALNPDCGLAPGSAARVDADEVWSEMKICWKQPTDCGLATVDQGGGRKVPWHSLEIW
jgi:5-methyltetrahydropteroyltriglutamate--homocysteine methyltransferase